MRRRHLAAAGLYALATVYYFAGIVRHPTSMLSFLWGDGFALLWDYWWANRCATALVSPFRTSLLSWGHEASLVFHPLDLFDGILSIPFQHLLPNTAGLVLGLNVIGVGCFLVSAFIMYLALWWLWRSWLAAVIGGFAYSFSAFHFWLVANPILGAMYWLPLLTILYLRAAEGWDWKRWLAAGLCFGLCPFQSLYHSLFLALLTPFLFVVALLRRDDRTGAVRHLLALTLFVGAFLLPMATLAVRDLAHTEYLAEGARDATQKVVQDDVHNSVDVAGLVIPWKTQGRWGPSAEAWNDYLKRPTVELMFRGQNGIGGKMAYVGLVPLVLFGAAALLAPPRLILPWAVCALVSLGLALGPRLHVHGWIFDQPWLPLPYRITELAPFAVTKMFRAPHYFLVPALFALWVVAAFGLRLLFEASRGRRLWTTLAIWLIVDYGRPPIAVYPLSVPTAYAKIAADPRPVKVLQVPPLHFFALEYWSFLQTVHQKPLVRGFIGRRDAWIAWRDEQMAGLFDNARRDAVLSRLGPTYIVVHREDWLQKEHYLPRDFALAAALERQPQLNRLYGDDQVTVYSLHLPRGDWW